MQISQIALSMLVASVAAAPHQNLDKRQRSRVGTVANEFTNGGCKDVIFIFARGTTEPGNMGTIVGPPTGQGLKDALGADRVAVQGVDYAAAVSTNLLPGGGDPAGIKKEQDLLTSAATSCPDSVLVVAGYSQGAAVAHGAIESLPASVQSRIAGVVTYGDTQNKQDNGKIDNFPADKVKVICNPGDLVCSGTLVIAAPHLDYARRAGEGVDFLVQKINAVL